MKIKKTKEALDEDTILELTMSAMALTMFMVEQLLERGLVCTFSFSGDNAANALAETEEKNEQYDIRLNDSEYDGAEQDDEYEDDEQDDEYEDDEIEGGSLTECIEDATETMDEMSNLISKLLSEVEGSSEEEKERAEKAEGFETPTDGYDLILEKLPPSKAHGARLDTLVRKLQEILRCSKRRARNIVLHEAPLVILENVPFSELESVMRELKSVKARYTVRRSKAQEGKSTLKGEKNDEE